MIYPMIFFKKGIPVFDMIFDGYDMIHPYAVMINSDT